MNAHIQRLKQKYGTPEQLSAGNTTVTLTDEQAAENLKAYSRRIAQPPAEIKPQPREFKQSMQYDEALAKLRKLFAAMLASERTARMNMEFSVPYTPEQKAVTYGLLRYFINDPTSPYPLNKGIYLYGPCGTGKTRLMELFQKLTTGTQKEFCIVNLTREIQNAKDHPEYDIVGTLVTGEKCLDEFGFTDDILNDHGNKTRVYDAAVYGRHIRSRNGKITHIVSNVPIEQAGQYIDFRNVDRLREMVTPVLFSGSSFRK